MRTLSSQKADQHAVKVHQQLGLGCDPKLIQTFRPPLPIIFIGVKKFEILPRFSSPVKRFNSKESDISKKVKAVSGV